MGIILTLAGLPLLAAGRLVPVRAATVRPDGGTQDQTGAGSVANQTLRFGALTLQGAGGARPLNGNGEEIDLTSCDGLVSGALGAYRPQVSGGRLSFTGAAGAPDGAVLRCTHAGGGQVDIAIAREPATYHCATGADIDNAVVHHNASGSGAVTLKIRRGTITDATEGTTNPAGVLDEGTFRNRNFAAKPMLVTAEDQNNRPTIRNWRLGCGGATGLTFSHFKIDGSAFTGGNLIHSASGNHGGEGIIFEYLEVYGAYQDIFGDYNEHTGSPYHGPWGLNLGGMKNSTVRHCIFHDLKVAASFSMIGDTFIEDNVAYNCYFDIYRYSIPVLARDFGTKSIRRNIGYNILGRSSDFDDPSKQPHPDAFQGAGKDSQTEVCELHNAIFEHNLLFSGATRGDDLQGPFTNYKLQNCIFRRNLILQKSTHGITVQNSYSNVFEENTVLSWDPSDRNGTPSIYTGWAVGAGSNDPPPSVGPHTIRRNVVGGITNFTQTNFSINDQMRAGNVRVEAASGDERYPMAFGRASFGPRTVSEAIAMFTPAVGSLAAIGGALDTNGKWRTGPSEPAMTDKPTLGTPAPGQISVVPAATIWDGVDFTKRAITGRDLRYSMDGSTWTTVTRAAGPITGLASSRLYFVQTREVNAVGVGPWSASATVTTT